MIKSRLVVSLLLILIFPLAQADTLTGRVVRVTDGDTIVVLDASKVQHKIRLTGYRCPRTPPGLRHEVQGASVRSGRRQDGRGGLQQTMTVISGYSAR